MRIAIFNNGHYPIGYVLRRFLDESAAKNIRCSMYPNDAGLGDITDLEMMRVVVTKYDAIVVIQHQETVQNLIEVATLCATMGIHYLDTSPADTMAKPLAAALKHLGKLDTTVLPHCGFAPGFINVLAYHLSSQYRHPHTCEISIGRLSKNVRHPDLHQLTEPRVYVSDYQYNPSISTEIRAGKRGKGKTNRQPPETVVIDERVFERLSAGGTYATLATTLHHDFSMSFVNAGMIRYPGHHTNMITCQPTPTTTKDLHYNPLWTNAQMINDDFVLADVHTLGGMGEYADDDYGKDITVIWTHRFEPMINDLRSYRASDWTTAMGVYVALRFLEDGLCDKGFVRQEHLDFASYMDYAMELTAVAPQIKTGLDKLDKLKEVFA